MKHGIIIRSTGSDSSLITTAKAVIGTLKRWTLGTPAEYIKTQNNVAGIVHGGTGKSPPHKPTLADTTT
eukprot:CAMPEP_0114680844 /NCGR_PEP_ID=MMETSP0191-20121206/54639_1 /TAXON_ID=126664 /ORGANISM="Sorites sp." /LENGTH=68 /DNA_ID=CAMNT_0001958243 /DNA_START=53 /DNA_END=255 /DNA_ORIENTATION=+